MSPKIILLGSLLVALDGVLGLNIQRLRAVEPLQDGVVVGYSIPDGLLKRQTATCPIGSRQCARISTGIFCAGVCCFENGEFSYGCDIGYYCAGSGANAGCCPVGRICTGGPPPCADNGEAAPSPTTACPADHPICTVNDRGAPLCSGDVTRTNTRSFVITPTNTISITTTSEVETETTEEPEPTTAEEPEPEPTTTEETTTVEEPTTFTTTGEIPEETTTEEPPSSTVVETTEETTTVEEPTAFTTTDEIPEETTTTEEPPSSTVVETTELPTDTPSPTQSSSVTLTPLPTPNSSGRTSAVNLIVALMSVAFAFFIF
ncbi:uncharacterized protein DFL_006313 [Arthrobotrys flagrans]|uniref:Uncharacterized protein n=1 Tax=Arthrobotrys flagrans TaxID=97331 RepID=A0A436ZZY3_ARTFL|nr:hypothetical protein DFL_006313 [Arthrobotrys flagrans]